MNLFPLNPDKSPATQGDWRKFKGNPKTALKGVPVPTGVIVFDLDLYKGVTKEQIESSLGARLPWEEAILQTTPNGGEHYAFQIPDAAKIKQGSNIHAIQGFDIRSSGKGYIATGEGYLDLTLFGLVETLKDREGLPVLPEPSLLKLSQEREQIQESELLDFVKTQPLDLTIEDVKKAIENIPISYSEDRDLWLKTGLAIYRQTKGSKEGWLIFDDFSKRCPDKYDRKKNYQTWKSFNRPYSGDPVTFASILHATKKDDFEKLLEESKNLKTLEDFENFKTKVKSKETVTKDQKKQLSTSIKENSKGTEFENLTKAEIKKELSQEKAFNPNTPDWCKPWIFVSKTCEFLNTETYATIKREAFNARFNKEKECATYEMQSSNLALNIYQIQNVHDTIFNPIETQYFKHEGEIYFNTYRKRGVSACEHLDQDGQNVINLFLKHLDFLIEKKEEKEIILNWLAHNIQKPGERINWALLIQGCQGSGKSYLSFLLSCVLGEHVTSLDPTSIAGRFTSWAYGSLVVAIEEIRISGTNRYEVLDRLKPFLTNDRVQVEEKGRDHRTVPNFTNYLMLTNHKDAIPLTDGDRRYCVIFSKIQTEEKLFSILGGENETNDYFDFLFSETKRRSDAIAYFFHNYKINPNFKARGRAPKTDAKNMMLAHAISPDRNKIEDLISEHECEVINKNIVDITWLNKLTELEGEMLPKTRAIAAILLEMGYENIEGRKVKIKTTKKEHTIWIKKEDMSSDDAKKIIRNFHDKEDDIPF